MILHESCDDSRKESPDSKKIKIVEKQTSVKTAPKYLIFFTAKLAALL